MDLDLYEDDSTLMEKVKNGDKTAYESLVVKYRANAVSFAYSFICDLYEAEDIVQECFAKLYINRMEYKALSSFKTYLFTIIRNNCIDYLRRNKKKYTINLDDVAEVLNNHAAPEDLLIKTERMTVIFRHIDSLPKDYKTALYLLAVDEMSYEQIAKVMRKSIPQIKIIIFRARKKLKKLCEGDDFFEK